MDPHARWAQQRSHTSAQCPTIKENSNHCSVIHGCTVLQVAVLHIFYGMLYLLLLVGLTAVSGQNPLPTLFSWKQVDWNFSNDSMRKSYEASGDFSPTSSLPLGVNVWQDKLFITVPRWKKGVPANLNYISLSEAAAKNETSPRLTPYPDWESNDIHTEDGIVNILRLKIDACDRLWAVDSGVDDVWGEFETVQPPKLIVIDLNTDKIIHRYTFKSSDLKPETFFADSIVDVDPNNCDDAYVYISDLGGYGLVVYSLAKNDSWRIENNYFHFDPLNGNYNISGINFQWTDGVFGLALSAPQPDGFKTLYFHAMSSTTEFAVSTKLLKDPEACVKNDNYHQFRVAGNKGLNTQSTAMAMDPESSIIYFTQLNKNGLACWDTHMELNPDTFRLVAQDNRTMVFPNDMALDTKSRKLYLVTDDLATFQYSKFDWDRTNFYVHVADLDDLTEACKGTSEP